MSDGIMGRPLRVLLIEDSNDDACLLLRELEHAGYEPTWERVETAADLGAALRRREWDIITCDYVMPNFGALAALELLTEQGCEVPVIIVTGEVGEEVAVAAMKAGASDYVSKLRLTRLVPAVERELRDAEVRRARRRADQALHRSQANLEAILNNSLQSFILLDCNGVIKAFNQIASVRAEVVFLTHALAEGALIDEFICGLDADEFRRQFARAVAGEVVVVETKFRNPAERDYWFELNFIPIRQEADCVTGVCLSMLDITERKRLEADLRDAKNGKRRAAPRASSWPT